MAPDPPTRPALSRRHMLIAIAAWIAVVAAVIGVAAALTDHPKPVEAASTPSPDLPPLSLALDHDLPHAAATATSATGQIQVLQEIAVADNTPRAWVDLGAARHYQGDFQGALLAYRRALALDPNRLDAQVGVLIVDAATESGRDRSAPALAALAKAHPDSQLVAFNQGMVAIYRRDPATARAAFRRVIAVDPSSGLGRAAARLVRAANGNTSQK